MAVPNETDSIVEISPNLVNLFRTTGQMLKPSLSTIREMVRQVPEGQLTTPNIIRQKLADRFGVAVTCPYDTRIALQAIANDPETNTAYWRVIKTNGELVAKYPGGTVGHAARLQEEGFTINKTGKKPKVAGFKAHLFQFD